VVVEAFCRGRAVVGTRGGGIEDIVDDGETGLLVPSDDVDGHVKALSKVLGDTSLAQRLGFAARAGSEQWYATPQEYAERLKGLVEGASERR
jgi:glycosyltransferase involved in cell wall biosynthesis